MTMKLGIRGRELIQSYEKLVLKAYLPTPDDVWTIGFGHTSNVQEGDTCTIEQANQWFTEDVSNAETAVNSMNIPLTQSMFDALVSLVFNVGSYPTTVKSIIGQSLRAGDYYTASEGFPQWRKQARKNMLGLARRRARELVLYFEDGMPR